jgi:hypothetical protein
MSVAYYALVELLGSVCAGAGYLAADRNGRFAVQAGSADEAALIRAGAIPINSAGQILSDQLANAGTPAPGALGEYLEEVVASGSAVALTTATGQQLAVLPLQTGDWDVDGYVGFVPGSGTAITALAASSSLTTAQIDSGASFQSHGTITPGAGNNFEEALPRRKYAGGQNVYLNALASFSGGTLSAYGTIRARRAG